MIKEKKRVKREKKAAAHNSFTDLNEESRLVRRDCGRYNIFSDQQWLVNFWLHTFYTLEKTNMFNLPSIVPFVTIDYKVMNNNPCCRSFPNCAQLEVSSVASHIFKRWGCKTTWRPCWPTLSCCSFYTMTICLKAIQFVLVELPCEPIWIQSGWFCIYSGTFQQKAISTHLSK